MGATNPIDEEGTIRKKYGISIDKNSCMDLIAQKTAKIEINFSLKIKYFNIAFG